MVRWVGSSKKTPVTWKLPDEEGAYWLTARMTGAAGRPVLSQRFVHAIKAPTLSEAIQQHTFVVLGSNDAARTFFKSKGLRMSERVDQLSPGSHVVVIWNVTHLTEEDDPHEIPAVERDVSFDDAARAAGQRDASLGTINEAAIRGNMSAEINAQAKDGHSSSDHKDLVVQDGFGFDVAPSGARVDTGSLA